MVGLTGQILAIFQLRLAARRFTFAHLLGLATLSGFFTPLSSIQEIESLHQCATGSEGEVTLSRASATRSAPTPSRIYKPAVHTCRTASAAPRLAADRPGWLRIDLAAPLLC